MVHLPAFGFAGFVDGLVDVGDDVKLVEDDHRLVAEVFLHPGDIRRAHVDGDFRDRPRVPVVPVHFRDEALQKPNWAGKSGPFHGCVARRLVVRSQKCSGSRFSNPLMLREVARMGSGANQFNGRGKFAAGRAAVAVWHDVELERTAGGLDVAGDGGKAHVFPVVFEAGQCGFLHFHALGKLRKRQAGFFAVLGQQHPDGKLAVVVVKFCPRLRTAGFACADEFFDVAHGRFGFGSLRCGKNFEIAQCNGFGFWTLRRR